MGHPFRLTLAQSALKENPGESSFTENPHTALQQVSECSFSTSPIGIPLPPAERLRGEAAVPLRQQVFNMFTGTRNQLGVLHSELLSAVQGYSHYLL